MSEKNIFYDFGESVFGAVAERMVENGWSIFPQETNGRSPGKVFNQIIKWDEKHDLKNKLPDDKSLKIWIENCSGLNVACVMGKGSGDVFCLDIDVEDEKMVSDILDISERTLGFTPLQRIGKYPKTALFFRYPKNSEQDFPNISRMFDLKDNKYAIEVISYGKAMTFYGTHHKTGTYFKWMDKTPLDVSSKELPEVKLEQLINFFNEVDLVYPFYKSPEENEITEYNESKTRITLKNVAGGTNWKQVDGLVVDGRESFLTYLCFLSARTILRSKEDIVDNKIKNEIKNTAFDNFKKRALIDRKWNDRILQKMIEYKVNRILRQYKNNVFKINQKYIPEKVEKTNNTRFVIKKKINSLIGSLEIPEETKEKKNNKENKPLKKIFSDFFNLDNNSYTVLKATTGMGKTTQLIQFIGNSEERKKTIFLLPNYSNIKEITDKLLLWNLNEKNLSDEDLKKFINDNNLSYLVENLSIKRIRNECKNYNIKYFVYSGKIKSGCHYPDIVDFLQKKSLSTQTLCFSKKDDNVTECQYYNDCNFIKQKENLKNNEYDIVFMPHNFLNLDIPKELKKYERIIVDENAIDYFIGYSLFNVDDLSENLIFNFIGHEFEILQNSRKILYDMLIENIEERNHIFNFKDKHDAIIYVKNSIDCLKMIIRDVNLVDPNEILNSVIDKFENFNIKKIKHEYGFLKKFLSILEENQEITNLSDFEYNQEKNQIYYSWMNNHNWNDKPFMFLDASASLSIYERIAEKNNKKLVFEDIHVDISDKIYSIAVISSSFSNHSFFVDKNSAVKLLSKIRKFLSYISILYIDKKILVGTTKKIENLLKINWESPINIDYCHFGAMRGLDKFKNHDVAISIGRLELPKNIVEEKAKIFSKNNEYINLDEDYFYYKENSILLKSNHVVKQKIIEYENKWSQIIQNQYREEEIRQFLGRLRLIYRKDKPLWINFCNITPKDVAVDEVVHLDDMLYDCDESYNIMRYNKGIITTKNYTGKINLEDNYNIINNYYVPKNSEETIKNFILTQNKMPTFFSESENRFRQKLGELLISEEIKIRKIMKMTRYIYGGKNYSIEEIQALLAIKKNMI